MNSSATISSWAEQAFPVKLALFRGIADLARAVNLTLGPLGGTVIIEQQTGSPLVTRDGAKVAKSIRFADRYENLGAVILSEVATNASAAAGDGSTTATALAEAIYRHGLKRIVSGANPTQVRVGMVLAVERIVSELIYLSTTDLESEELIQVAAICANGDRAVGEMIAKAVNFVGRGGVVTIDESQTAETVLELLAGFHFNSGYLSPYFATESQVVTLELPWIFVCESKIEYLKDFLPLLEAVAKSGRPLLIVAGDVKGEALATLVLNKLRQTIQVVAVKAPGFADRQRALLDDIAVYTGTKGFFAEFGSDLAKVSIDDLGQAGKVIVDANKTVILEGAGSQEQRTQCLEHLHRQMMELSLEKDRGEFEDRIARLASRAALVRVGAATSTELKEKKVRFQNALNSVRAASEEGVVPGGGVALLRAQRSLDDLEFEDERRFGVDIIRQAVEAPLRQLARNAGAEPGAVVQEVRSRGPFDGYNARTKEYEDFFSAGILDATKVVPQRPAAAASLANLLLSTKTIVSRYKRPRVLHDPEVAVRSPLKLPPIQKRTVGRLRHKVECLFEASGGKVSLDEEYFLEVIFHATPDAVEEEPIAALGRSATTPDFTQIWRRFQRLRSGRSAPCSRRPHRFATPGEQYRNDLLVVG